MLGKQGLGRERWGTKASQPGLVGTEPMPPNRGCSPGQQVVPPAHQPAPGMPAWCSKLRAGGLSRRWEHASTADSPETLQAAWLAGLGQAHRDFRGPECVSTALHL